MKKGLFEMQQEDTTLREQLESTLANTADPNRPRRTRHDELSQGPFLDNLYPDRSVQIHPLVYAQTRC